MIPPGVDLEPHLALRRDLRRARARARRQDRAAPRVDLQAWLQGWTDPPRNRPPGLDPAAQFLHDAFDGIVPGVAPLVPRIPDLAGLWGRCQTCEGIDPPARVGDDCNEGGEVVNVTGWTLVPDALGDHAMCVASITCRGNNKCDCYTLERAQQEGNGARYSCGAGIDEVLSMNCSYAEEEGKGVCYCHLTCLMDDGSTKTANWYDNPRGVCGAGEVDADAEESSFAYAEPRPCETPEGWGEAPGGNGPGGWMEEGKRAWEELSEAGASAWQGFSEWAEGQDWGGIFGGTDLYPDILDECLAMAARLSPDGWNGWCDYRFTGHAFKRCKEQAHASVVARRGYCYNVFGS
ncbi:MAG: hypothetical protein FJ102_11455 [Deltaproteobacteria bacterium]|nr:hypothetical protein [Deltaproteobacteria bacterium]